jgi:hypothetical protein
VLRYKPAQFLHRFRDVIFENFRVRMTSFQLMKLYSLSNFDRLYLRQYRSYEQASKHRTASFWPEKGFGTSLGCHRYFSMTQLPFQVKRTVGVITTDFRSSEKKTLKSGPDLKFFRTWISSFRHQEHGESNRRKTFVANATRDKTLNPFSLDRKSVVL